MISLSRIKFELGRKDVFCYGKFVVVLNKQVNAVQMLILTGAQMSSDSFGNLHFLNCIFMGFMNSGIIVFAFLS